jgi:hypothetical protein
MTIEEIRKIVHPEIQDDIELAEALREFDPGFQESEPCYCAETNAHITAWMQANSRSLADLAATGDWPY